MDDRPTRSGGSGRSGRRRRRDGGPPSPSGPPSDRRARRRRNYGVQLAQLAIAMVSVLVLGLTGYGWATFQTLHEGLSTTNVIGWAVPDKATDILLVGLDSRTDAHDNPLAKDMLARLRAGDNEDELTDTMILVRIPNDGQHAVAISLPRDLYVELPDGYGKHKLNSAFARARNATAERLVAQGVDPATVRTESIAAGRKVLLQAVKDLTGIGIDHYAEINLLGFSLLTDAVGGVPVCLKAPVHDRFSGANFPAGQQLISGPDALAFVRQRHGLPRGDLDRIVRQQAYLASLAHKVLTAGTLANPSRINQLINATQQSLVLDEGFDVLDFATRIQGLAAGNVVFETVPVLGDGTSESDGAVLNVDPDAVHAFVGQAITPSTTDPKPDSAAKPPLTFDVFNASTVRGLAKSVSDQLAGQGFMPETVGTSPTRPTSVVRYPTGGQDAARTVAAALGGMPVEEDSQLVTGTVQIYLGKDYAGPGRSRVAGALARRVQTPAESDVARPVAEATDADSTTIAASPTSTPPAPAPPPRPSMVGGKAPCVS
ncbi:MAG: LCP family protein [Actinomycetota bacterium]|nr:LCP family protein [Actinomycetota bacterium]